MQYDPLGTRHSKLDIRAIAVTPEASLKAPVGQALAERLRPIADRILRARQSGAPVVCAFGAHAIKNGLGPLLAGFAGRGWITHLATNGAGVIHDWEFSYQGQSSEDVRANVRVGRFGTWEETGLYINLAITLGAYEGRGYGESVGSLIAGQGLRLPLEAELLEAMQTDPALWRRAAAADLLDSLRALGIAGGFYPVQHPYSAYSVQAAALTQGFHFTAHPMFGHDIIYTHRANKGAAIGRTAERDFLLFADSVSRLEGGVYLSVGSSVMSPMIFEKALSMARNVRLQQNQDIRDCQIVVVDLQEETWDWSRGEPPDNHPAYYHRFMKTFSRMACPVTYLCADNRLFFQGLYQALARRA